MNNTPVDKTVMRKIKRAIRQINPHLQGIGEDVQGAVLAELVSMWVAGHHPAIREGSLEVWLSAMRAMIPINEQALFEHYGGRPKGWEVQ